MRTPYSHVRFLNNMVELHVSDRPVGVDETRGADLVGSGVTDGHEVSSLWEMSAGHGCHA